MISNLKKMSVLALALLGFGLAACSSDDGSATAPKNYLAIATDAATADVKALAIEPKASAYVSDALPAVILEPVETCVIADKTAQGCQSKGFKVNLTGSATKSLVHAVIFDVASATINGQSICGNSAALSLLEGSNLKALPKGDGDKKTDLDMFAEGLACTDTTPVIVGFDSADNKSCLFDGSDDACSAKFQGATTASASDIPVADLLEDQTFFDFVYETKNGTFTHSSVNPRDEIFDDAGFTHTATFTNFATGTTAPVAITVESAQIDPAFLNNSSNKASADYMKRAFGDVLYTELASEQTGSALPAFRELYSTDLCSEKAYLSVGLKNGVTFVSKPTEALEIRCASLADYNDSSPVYKLITEEASKADFIKATVASGVQLCEVKDNNTCNAPHNLIASLITVEGTVSSTRVLTSLKLVIDDDTNSEIVLNNSHARSLDTTIFDSNAKLRIAFDKYDTTNKLDANINAKVLGLFSSHGLCATDNTKKVAITEIVLEASSNKTITLTPTTTDSALLNGVCGISDLISIPHSKVVSGNTDVTIKINGIDVDFTVAIV